MNKNFFEKVDKQLSAIFGGWIQSTNRILKVLRMPILFTIFGVLAPFYFITRQHQNDTSPNGELTGTYKLSLMVTGIAAIVSAITSFAVFGPLLGTLLMPVMYYVVLMAITAYLESVN